MKGLLGILEAESKILLKFVEDEKENCVYIESLGIPSNYHPKILEDQSFLIKKQEDKENKIIAKLEEMLDV